MKNKSEWLEKWLPDYFIFTKSGQLVAVEMKAWKNKATPEQEMRIEKLNNCWVPAKVCWWYKEAIAFILENE